MGNCRKSHYLRISFFTIIAASYSFADTIEVPAATGNVQAIEVVEAPSAPVEVVNSPVPSKPEPAAKPKASLPKASPKNTPVVAAPSFAKGTAGISLQSAKGEKLAIAMGHFARSRALLISALREFDKGYAIVDPSALVDAEGWRQGVAMRAEELARVLDPQPRASRTGVRFDESTAGTGDAGSFGKR